MGPTRGRAAAHLGHNARDAPMDSPAAPPPPDARHWRASRRLAVTLTLLWLAVWLLPLLLPGWFEFEFLGAPFLIWLCSTGAPIAFVLLVWRYERAMVRIDREREAGRVD